MPVKTTAPKASETVTVNTGLDTATTKLIGKLSIGLAKKAAGLRVAQENLQKSTFALFNDFRNTSRENFNDLDDKLKKKAARQLAINVLASVYDTPTTAINIAGQDKAVYVYPEEYENRKGKIVAHPSAGEIVDADDLEKMDDEEKAILIHPAVKGAARLYQLASKLVVVAFPENDRARKLVDEALSEDGECQVTEDRLVKLANGSETEIVPKAGHGGKRAKTVWDKKKVTEELTKLFKKGWDGAGIVKGYEGSLDLEDLGEISAAVLANLESEKDASEKAAKKAADKGKAEESNQDEE